MGSRKQRKRRAGRKSRGVTPAPPGEFLVTIGTGPSDGPCDCPICQVMGIDLSQSDGIDVRPIDDEQRALLAAFFEDGAEGN